MRMDLARTHSSNAERDRIVPSLAMETILALIQMLFVDPTHIAVCIVDQGQIFVMESMSTLIMRSVSHVSVTDVHPQSMYSSLHSPSGINR